MSILAVSDAVLAPWIGWVLLIVLGLLWVFLGILWGRKAKNLEGYMFAGRNVGLALGSATAMATWVTSNTTMLAPQFALQLGIWGMLAYSTASFGLFLFAPMAKRIRDLMPKGYSSGDFIRLRYGKLAWVCYLGITLFYSITWLISMGMAGGILLNVIAGVPYEFGMTAILLVCVLYTLFGGLYAVIGTDFIQSAIILVGLVVVGVVVVQNVEFGVIYSDLRTEQPALLKILLPAAIIALFNNMLFGIGEVFNNNVWWSRAFAFRKEIVGRAFALGGLFWLPIPIAAGFIALAAGSLGLNVVSPDMVGPLVISNLLGVTGSVLVFIIIFCSLASSIDSLLAATSDLVTEDIYRKGFRPNASQGELRFANKGIVIAIGALCWLICLPRIGDLATVLFFAGPLVGSLIWPIAAGLFWKQTNPRWVIAAMVAGSVLGLVAYFNIGWYSGALVAAAVSMVLTAVGIWVFPKDFDWNVLNESPPKES